ncbi:MAG: glutathione peroxidase [Paracoccaceae bacterium]
MLRHVLVGLAGAVMAVGVAAAAPAFTFSSIEGGEISLETYRGGPVLVVNTASRCGYTYQYAGLQQLYDTYRARGLVVLAVPSDAFNQELSSNDKVKEFCEVTYGLTIPMTEMTEVKGAGAHPLFAWLKATQGFEPSWNFNKVLLDAEGEYVESWGSGAKPMSPEVTGRIEGVLAGG